MGTGKTGDDYADAVMARIEGRPIPNIQRLVSDAFNAGYVQALMDRQSKGRTLRDRIQPPASNFPLGKPSKGRCIT